jgi:hypothetical protein
MVLMKVASIAMTMGDCSAEQKVVCSVVSMALIIIMVDCSAERKDDY